ncbi:MAG TPA: tyrosine--tRNA ligase [Candidatus Acidoferrales bacterium]|nr:tyrosine--tRNA ligase [Candidatus Acidoferrales bacterium]
MEKVAFKPVEEQLAYLKKGAAEIIREDELKTRLENSLKTGKPLRVYLGVDPTAPDIHLGHTVVLRKLKHFQDMGHTAIFLIGDFSAMIGDPTGVSETRPPLTREQVDANAKTYLAQVYKILDREKTEVRYNSEWLGKMPSHEVVKLCGHYRLARMLEREDFRSRLEKSQPISVHELLYPLLTAYDAVALQSDVELGATEQKFNLLVHRDIQREYGQTSETVLTMPILVGLDGERKMSKSLGNYVGITEAPGEMFGKLMSITDDLMWSYYELLTDFASPVIVRMREEVRTSALHPKKTKLELAHVIVAQFHGEEAAKKAGEEWDLIYSKRQLPSEMKVFSLPAAGKVKLAASIAAAGLAPSRAEAERLIKQGAVEWNGARVNEPTYTFDSSQPGDHTLRVGKKPAIIVRIEK